MAAETLHDTLVEELRDLLHAEKQLTKALPKMAKAADSEELASAFESHLAETETQVDRLEEALKSLGETVRAKTCEGMEGIVEESAEVIKKNEAGALRDAMLIGGAQKVEHYEIASYGTVIAWAEQLNLSQVVKLLNKSLAEEKAADDKLTKIAMTLNVEAEVAVEA